MSNSDNNRGLYFFIKSVFVWHRHSGADQILTDFYVSAIPGPAKKVIGAYIVKIRQAFKIAVSDISIFSSFIIAKRGAGDA